MEKISSLGLSVKIIPILTTLHKNLLREEKVLDPDLKLSFISQNLNEIPLSGLSLLLDAVKARAGLSLNSSPTNPHEPNR